QSRGRTSVTPVSFDMPQTDLPRPLRRSLRELRPYIAPHLRGVTTVAVLAIAVASFSAFEPLLMKTLFDRLVTPSDVLHVFALLGVLVLLLATREVMALVQDRLFWKVRTSANFALLQATVERLHSLPLSFHGDASVGATMTRIERGITGAMTAFTEVLLQ